MTSTTDFDRLLDILARDRRSARRHRRCRDGRVRRDTDADAATGTMADRPTIVAGRGHDGSPALADDPGRGSAGRGARGRPGPGGRRDPAVAPRDDRQRCDRAPPAGRCGRHRRRDRGRGRWHRAAGPALRARRPWRRPAGPPVRRGVPRRMVRLGARGGRCSERHLRAPAARRSVPATGVRRLRAGHGRCLVPDRGPVRDDDPAASCSAVRSP